MPGTTITDGLTFSNWGPLTTTFTAPTSCATATGNYMIVPNSQDSVFLYSVQCSTDGFFGCTPTGTASVQQTFDNNPSVANHVPYYSPGLYCPSGWATVGAAARDADNSLSSSGVLRFGTMTDSAVSMPQTFAQFENPTSLLVDLLSPRETLVMCCPSSMTPDVNFGCYSTVSNYKATEACMDLLPNLDVDTSTKTEVVHGTTTVELLDVVTGTYPLTPSTTTFNSKEASYLIAVSVMPMLRLVRHQSDLSKAASGITATPHATSTSNGAAKAALNKPSSDGLGFVFGISAAAMVLGAAIVAPW